MERDRPQSTVSLNLITAMSTDDTENERFENVENLEELAAELADLHPKKQRALQLQLAGTHTKGEICEELGIDRSTFWRWRNRDVPYRSALHRARQYRCEQTLDRLLSADRGALDRLEEVLPEADASLVLQYLKERGLLGTRPPSSPTDPIEELSRSALNETLRRAQLLNAIADIDEAPKPGESGNHGPEGPGGPEASQPPFRDDGFEPTE